jgi:hypothetical protein
VQLTVPQEAAPGDEIVVTAACGYFDRWDCPLTLVSSVNTRPSL